MIPSLINVEPNVFTQSPQVPLIIKVKWTAPIKYVDTIPTGTLKKIAVLFFLSKSFFIYIIFVLLLLTDDAP